MTRRKADGTAFEVEFRKCIAETNYVKRLHTPNAGFSGLREPADFIVLGRGYNYVELKETAKPTFAVSQMEQLDMIKEFQEDCDKYLRLLMPVRMNYWLIVHFIEQGVYVAVDSEYVLNLVEKHKTLRYDDKYAMKFNKLEDLWRIPF